jgi:hypothetical protein
VGEDLMVLGLKKGDVVRWRQAEGARWHTGRVSHVERDGSIAVTDGKGRARSLLPTRLELSCEGPRGGHTWEAVASRATRPDQLRLI